jgi:hypothetical protein
MRFSSMVFAGIVAACAVSAASAQASVDRTFTASSRDCRDVQWSADLRRDYPGRVNLNFCVPEDRLVASFFADDSGTKSVAVPIVREQVATLAALDLLDLPTTGSSLPLVGWFAVLVIFVGTGVTVYRMLRE